MKIILFLLGLLLTQNIYGLTKTYTINPRTGQFDIYGIEMKYSTAPFGITFSTDVFIPSIVNSTTSLQTDINNVKVSTGVINAELQRIKVSTGVHSIIAGENVTITGIDDYTISASTSSNPDLVCRESTHTFTYVHEATTTLRVDISSHTDRLESILLASTTLRVDISSHTDLLESVKLASSTLRVDISSHTDRLERVLLATATIRVDISSHTNVLEAIRLSTSTIRVDISSHTDLLEAVKLATSTARVDISSHTNRLEQLLIDTTTANVSITGLQTKYSTGSIYAIFIDTAQTGLITSTVVVRIPFDCTIKGWYCRSDKSGDCVVQVASASWSDTMFFDIGGTDPIDMKAQTTSSSTALTGWTVNIDRGTFIRFMPISATTLEQIFPSIEVWKR